MKQIEEVTRRIARDCSSFTTPPTTAQLKSRKEISDYIDHTKAKFQRILDGDLTRVAEHDGSMSDELLHDDDDDVNDDEIVKNEPVSQ